MEKNVDDLLTLEQAAKKVKISIRMLQKEMAAGSVSYVKIGRLTRFLPSDIEAFILSRRIPSRKQLN